MSERTKYLTIFRGEAEEHLTSLRDGLMMLEGSPGDSELLLRVMRNAHTLKGTSRMMGFHGMGEVAHKMEDVLTEVESNPAVLTEETLSVLLSAVDYIAEVLAAVGAKKKSPPVPAELVANLRSTIERPGRETPTGKTGL
ncbi:MAG: Hpt domain-containing protein, partial [Planctomycetota bacterium]|nr:Hpt domain-containing protein [Planctomycetota bacterium]